MNNTEYVELKRTYLFLQTLAQRGNCEQYLEPFEHVETVHRLRQQYRPSGPIRLVVIGESHVRRPVKPGFIYDHTYYTPWWRDLLSPAFGLPHPVNAEERRKHLLQLQRAGFWLLDVSVIALSGYQTVQKDWPKRPLDTLLPSILQESWHRFTANEWEECGSPALCYFERIASVLPESLRAQGVPLRFNSPRHANALRYNDPAYRFGTARFTELVQSLGLRCYLSPA